MFLAAQAPSTGPLGTTMMKIFTQNDYAPSVYDPRLCPVTPADLQHRHGLLQSWASTEQVEVRLGAVSGATQWALAVQTSILKNPQSEIHPPCRVFQLL